MDSSDRVSVTGSLNTGSPLDPDRVHFANWMRLNEVSWQAVSQPGRSFNSPPFSVRDSAICYYFDPQTMNPGERRSFGFTLALNGDDIPSLVNTSGQPYPALRSDRDRDLAELREIMEYINALMYSGMADEEELEALESYLDFLRAKYNMR